MSNVPHVSPMAGSPRRRSVYEEEDDNEDDAIDDEEFDRDLFRAWRSYRLDLLSPERENIKRKSQKNNRTPNESSSWDLPEDHEQESTGLFWISSSARKKQSSTTNQRRRQSRHHATSSAARAAMDHHHPDTLSIATSSDGTPVISNAILSSSFSSSRNSKNNKSGYNGSSEIEVSSFGGKKLEEDDVSFLSTSSYNIYHYSSQQGGNLIGFLRRRRRIVLVLLINMLLITLITTMSILAFRNKQSNKMKNGSDPTNSPPFSQNEDDDVFPVQNSKAEEEERSDRLHTIAPTIATSWTVLKKLNPKDNGELGYGNAVQLSSDGTVLAVATINKNVYVYQDADDETLFSVERLILGSSTYTTEGTPAIDLSRDGSILAISDPVSDQKMGRIRIFRYKTNPSTGQKSYEPFGQDIVGSQPRMLLGTALAISDSGRYIVAGAPFSGEVLRLQGQVMVYEYQESTNRWESMGAPLIGLRASSRFGSAVAIHHEEEDDSGTITFVASASNDEESAGYMTSYQWNKRDESPSWVLLGKDPIENPSEPKYATDRFGSALSLRKISPSLFRLAVGVPGKVNPDASVTKTGMVVVYKYDLSMDTEWMIVGTPLLSQDPGIQFGQSVTLIDDVVLVGAPGASQEAGLVRLLKHDSSTGSFLLSKAKTGFFPGDGLGIAVSAARRSSDNRTIFVAGATARKSQNGPGYVLLIDV